MGTTNLITMCNIGKLSVRIGSCHDFEQAKIHIDPPKPNVVLLWSKERLAMMWHIHLNVTEEVCFLRWDRGINMFYLYVLFWFGYVVITCTLIQLAVIYHTIYQVQVDITLICYSAHLLPEAKALHRCKLRWLVNQWPMFMAYQWLPQGMVWKCPIH